MDDASTLTTIEIAKEYLNFSAGHFTLFSATERENLHGHNFALGCDVTAPIGPGGLCFDYVMLKKKLKALCDELDEVVLLPGRSPWLRIEQEGDQVIARFADERIPFLARDVKVLDVRNISVEELAGWFLARLRDDVELGQEDLRAITVRVSSGSNQWASQTWSA